MLSAEHYRRRHRSRPLRAARKWLTGEAVRSAVHLAPLLPAATVYTAQRGLESTLTRFGPHLPYLAEMVRRNMRVPGVYRVGALPAYFRQIALHFAGALHIFQRAGRNTGDGRGAAAAPSLAELARERICLDDTLDHLHRAVGQGRGVILAPSHACQFLIALARLNQEVPLTVYLRYARRAYNRAAKVAWCRAAGMHMIAEPSRVTDPGARSATLAAALAEKRVLVLTPDLAQRRGKGIPVRLFDREVYMASGAASLAVLTGAPVVPVTARTVGRRNCFVFHEPLHMPRVRRRRGWRREAIRVIQQQWADLFAAFLGDAPHLWYLWADSRWSRVFRGDPKYCTCLRPATMRSR